MVNECYTTDTVGELSRGISNLLSEETEKETVQREVSISLLSPGQHRI